ncbi:hypothetical protein JCM18909_490 [Cutibacterium acnes JCM 18909]|nr:hypothetical protein JCM18909_490 [Cutibacterium acnes JCM 18909]
MVALAGEAEMAEWLVIVVIMVIASGWLARRALRRLLASRRPPAPPCPAWDSASSARDRWSSPRGGCDRSGGWICLTMALAHNGQRLGDHVAGYIMGAAVLGTLGAVMSAHLIIVWCADREQLRLPKVSGWPWLGLTI